MPCLFLSSRARRCSIGTEYISPDEFLAQAGFGNTPPPHRTFSDYPDLSAQLDVLRRIAPTSDAVALVEAHLDRALRAKAAGNGAAERSELGAAREKILRAMQAQTPAGQWPTVFWILAAISVLAIAWWWAQQRKKQGKRRLTLPQPIDDEEAEGDDDTEWTDDGDEEA